MTEFLIGHSVDVNARDFSVQTVLGAISGCPHREWDWNFIQMYLDNGGDALAVDGLSGGTVLHFAAESKFVSTLDDPNKELELNTWWLDVNY